MRVLDLFSGIGGFSLGLERAGMTTAAFCEIDPYCRAVLKKHWPGVPIYEDVRTIPTIGGIDLICGGFPCQPFSVAGLKKGSDDDRHLWPSMFEIIKRERPAWVIGENVTGLIRLGLDSVLINLEEEGYSARTFAIPACGVDAPHRRERIWIVAYPDSERRRLRETRRENAENVGQSPGSEGRFDWWDVEPAVGRVAHGVPKRVDRIKSLGNAVVPQVVEKIGRAIMEVSNERSRL